MDKRSLDKLEHVKSIYRSGLSSNKKFFRYWNAWKQLTSDEATIFNSAVFNGYLDRKDWISYEMLS
jgi:hypothetical protein